MGIEPATYGLQNRCSAIELHRPMILKWKRFSQWDYYNVIIINCKAFLSIFRRSGGGIKMNAVVADNPVLRIQSHFPADERGQSFILKRRSVQPFQP